MCERIEKLFLMEFFVDSVKMNNNPDIMNRIANCNSWSSGTTTVSFQFFGYPTFEISEGEFGQSGCKSDEYSCIKSGKSCLFAVPGQLEHLKDFLVNIGIFRNLPEGCAPNRLLIGRTAVQMACSYNAIVDSLVNDSEKVPVSKSIREYVPFNTPDGKLAGEISLFIRLACFGKMIVTQFQMVKDASNKCFLFKGDSPGVYHCQKLLDAFTPCPPNPSPSCCPPCPAPIVQCSPPPQCPFPPPDCPPPPQCTPPQCLPPTPECLPPPPECLPPPPQCPLPPYSPPPPECPPPSQCPPPPQCLPPPQCPPPLQCPPPPQCPPPSPISCPPFNIAYNCPVMNHSGQKLQPQNQNKIAFTTSLSQNSQNELQANGQTMIIRCPPPPGCPPPPWYSPPPGCPPPPRPNPDM